MYVMVLILNKDEKVNEEYAFPHDFPEFPQVGDTIELCGAEIDERWFPELKNYGAKEFFKVVNRGWRIVTDEKVTCPYIVVRNKEYYV